MLRWARHALKFAITVIILGLFAWKSDVRSTIAGLAAISPFAVTGAIAFLLLQSLLLAMRLTSVVALFEVTFPYSESYRVTLESMFFSQTFISFIGGDALRIWRVQRFGLPLADATSAIVLDRLTGILVNHLFLLASLPWLLARLPNGAIKIALLLLAGAGVAGFGVLLLLGFLRGRLGLFRRLPERLKVAAVVTLLLETSTVGRHLLARPYQLVDMFVLSALAAVCNIIIFAILLFGLGVDLPLAIACALLVPAILEIAMLPISIAGWGIREAATVMAFGALGLPPDIALGSSVAFGLIIVGISLIGGLLWLIDRRQITALSKQDESGIAVLAHEDPSSASSNSPLRRS